MNYYELLGIKETATEEEIKRAYKREMKKWHPDINKTEEAVSMSTKINEAKEVLLNETKRKEYDLSLKKEETKTYEKYSSVNTSKSKKEERKEKEEVYETKTVTKWEYLKDYLKYGNLNIFKKSFVLICVLLESLLCFILKYLVIGLSFFCFIFSSIVIMFFNYLYPLIILLIGVFIYLLASSGMSGVVENHIEIIRAIIILATIFILSYILPFIGKKLLSEKVFNFLYNKLDIYLFKKAVGYK